MSFFRTTAILSALIVGNSAFAASPEELDQLYDAMGLPRLMDIMRIEGLNQGEQLEADMLGGDGGEGWNALLDGIYSTETMSETFRIGFDAVLEEVDVAPLLAFYASALGAEVVSLELAGREALLDEDLEAAAEAAFEDLDDDARRTALEVFIEQNNLIDLNVMGGLNSSLAFYEGMADGGLPITEDQMLQDVWSQEPDLRDSTETWIYSYLNLAYEPLDADDLKQYIDVTGSEAGKALNRALFEGFDQVFIDISRALGRASAIFSRGEEL